MPTATRQTKVTRKASDVVLLTGSEALAAKRATKATASKQKSSNPVARKEKHPALVNSADIIEISSDEDDEPIFRDAGASKLKERIIQLEKENASIKSENEAMKQNQTMTTELEDGVTCEICSSKMWSPFILPDCGHTFCQKDLEDWFSAALKQHRNTYPNFHAGMAGPMLGMMQLPLPPYSCPKCREKVRSKPIQNFAVKSFVRVVAKHARETSPKKAASSNNIWSQFFPS
ncbi:hypothetical protein GGX14DRAFT_50984 [Mycena pura]|uniref:RING-type domain-containing protein n=1 Tax=Mycena pura TaxID=153505 RepID=A0AAD6VLR4_9AGAR|nr:hypothetical protein GGX14DRAFT_50984 [Mycena pura]